MCNKSDGSKELVRAFPPFARATLLEQLRELHAPRNIAIWTDTVELLDVYQRAMEIAAVFGTPSPHDAYLRRLIATREHNYVAAAHIVASILVCRKIDLHWHGEPPHVRAFLDRLEKTFQTPQSRGLTLSDIQLLNVCCVVFACDPQWADVDSSSVSFASSPTGMPAGDKRTHQQMQDTRSIEHTLDPHMSDALLRYVGDDVAVRYIEATGYRFVERQSPIVRGQWVRYTPKKRVVWTNYRGPYRITHIVLRATDTMPIPVTVRDVQLAGAVDFTQRLPSHITHLSMRKFFNQTFSYPKPCNITHVTFGNNFNQKVQPLPCSVTHFTMNHEFTEPLTFEEPSQLIDFTMGEMFQHETFRLPASVRIFVMGDEFNAAGFQLPDGVTDFEMGFDFNQPGFVLPSSVRRFEMGNAFNQTDFIVPDTVTHLKTGANFNPSHFVISHNLVEFKMGSLFQSHLTFPSTSRLTKIKMGYLYDRPGFYVPEGVTIFDMGRDFNHPLPMLPASLIRFDMGNKFDQPLTFHPDCRLTHFTLGAAFDQRGFVLPSTVTNFSLRWGYNRNDLHIPYGVTDFQMNHKFDGTGLTLPDTLTNIEISNSYNQSDLVLPRSITHILMGTDFEHALVFKSTPANQPVRLHTLEMGEKFNAPIPHMPSYVLVMGRDFNQPGVQLPPTLKRLTMASGFQQSDLHLPASLTYLKIAHDFKGTFTCDPTIMLDELHVSYQYNPGALQLPPHRRLVRY